eukprot:Seg2951.2 transcript_id=Seg2951.2/GoldUCD/mRNA.D3Y31 product="hypothetical protein" protein_id=Seg2951.2/GoldUCD/D3Y31
MDEVDTMILEPFDLHSTEQLNHSPSDYLSTNFKFYLSSENTENNVEHKEDMDVDALWTKAVDNMFRSSRLFNGDSKEEEKENVDENVLDASNFTKELDLTAEIGEVEPSRTIIKHEETLQALDLEPVGEIDGSSNHFSSSNDKAAGKGDQIVPTVKTGVVKLGVKRKFADLDVSFSSLDSLKPASKLENKKLKLDPESGKEVIEREGTIGELDPPKNSLFVDYVFDCSARLPSFREAFVPALKKISRREKELRRQFKNRQSSKDRAYTHRRKSGESQGPPVRGHDKYELHDQTLKDDTGAILGKPSDHQADLLSDFDGMERKETIDETKANLSVKGTDEKSKLSDISGYEEHSSKSNEHQLNIKQENPTHFLDCNRTSNDNNVTETPSKFLGLSSANLKDIEKNIFSFDDGLDMLDLERDFPLQNIAEHGVINHENGVSAVRECDWTLGLPHVPDIQGASEHPLISHNASEVDNLMAQRDLVMTRPQQYFGNSANTSPKNMITPQSSFAVTLVNSRPNESINLSHFVPHGQMNLDMAKQNILGQAEQHRQQQQQQEMNMMNMKQNPEFNFVNRDEHPVNINQVHFHNNQTNQANMHQSQASMHQNQANMHQNQENVHQNQANFRNNNGIGGQLIAQQIHQSFGADVFGAPEDDGAKILAKYLAQRGSTRPDGEEQKGSMTSAIASLISKSFSQQEATHRMPQRDNGHLEFLNPADLEHLDLMNEQF